MNDNELRTAAEEVARALGLYTKVYRCPDCVQHFPKRARIIAGEGEFCGQCGRFWSKDWPYAEGPLDLLTEAGALALQDAIVKQGWFLRLHRYMQRENTGPREYFSVFIKNTETGQEFHRSQDHANTWPAALVLVAHEAKWCADVECAWWEREH
jgi:hypothetical protein